MSEEEYIRKSIEAITRIEERQVANSDKLDAAIMANTSRFEKIETRVADVEKKQWALSGAGAVMAFIASKIWK